MGRSAAAVEASARFDPLSVARFPSLAAAERPVTKRGSARRERIVAAAVGRFSQDGFTNVSLADIAAEAGIVGSGVYRHFRSKTDLLAHIFAEAGAELERHARSVLAGAENVDEAIVQLVEGHIEFTLRQIALNRVYLRESHYLDADESERVKRHQRAYVRIWTQVLAEIRPDVGEQECRVLVLSAIGGIHSLLTMDQLPPERVLRRVLRAGALAVLHARSTDGALQRKGSS